MNTTEVLNEKYLEFDRNSKWNHTVPQAIIDLGFEDQSWHNDMCPSYLMFQETPLQDPNVEARDLNRVELWVDHVDPTKREENDWPRFRIYSVMYNTPRAIIETDSLEELLAKVKAMRDSMKRLDELSKRFGTWHLDDNPEDVCWETGNVPTKEEMSMMRETIIALNFAWETDDTACNAGAWTAASFIEQYQRFKKYGDPNLTKRHGQLVHTGKQHNSECPVLTSSGSVEMELCRQQQNSHSERSLKNSSTKDKQGETT